LALGFFPGVFTLALSVGLIYLLWTSFLTTLCPWLAVPIAIVSFLLAWLVLGKIALIPVEDPIIDECQRIALGEVRYPAAPMSLPRWSRELFFSLLMILPALAVVLLGLVPVFTWLSFLLAAWISAYSFLAPAYARMDVKMSGRIAIFFQDAIPNLLLGIFLNFLLFVPLLNVFLLGYAQVLAALVFLRRRA
jgi:hypothetical protein